jgi:hypothetical protein
MFKNGLNKTKNTIKMAWEKVKIERSCGCVEHVEVHDMYDRCRRVILIIYCKFHKKKHDEENWFRR